jgi:hypothetical protein
MDEHAYGAIEAPLRGLSVFEAFNQAFRAIFEPWEQHPRMLEVFATACASSGGERLRRQGLEAVGPLRELCEPVDPVFATDLSNILTNVVEGLLARYVRGEIAVTAILPGIESTLYRLEAAAPNAVMSTLVGSNASNHEGMP